MSLVLWAVVGVVVLAGVVALYLIVSERRRHELVEQDLSSHASFLESLVESMGAIARTLDAQQVLEQARIEAEQLFGARAELVHGAEPVTAPGSRTLSIPLRARGLENTALRVERDRPFDRNDAVRATVLADFAARASENARLFAEAQVREAERARLSEQLVTAEQDERRRLALFLHDTSVQALSGIALMFDAASHLYSQGQRDEADKVLASALERQRETIRALRDLSFNLEPVVLRDQGFDPAVRALAEQLQLANALEIEVDVAAAESLPERTKAALYQIIREALNQAILRGPPTSATVSVARSADGAIALEIADNAPGERRRRSFEALEERARSLSGVLSIEYDEDGGTRVHVTIASYATG